jgi:AraC family transcriptional regulator, regulatory protein of adaptative response / methylated-DNA-[protein]-cysteine methyltransferase
MLNNLDDLRTQTSDLSVSPPDPLKVRNARLAQIRRRDPEAEGVFWYSVSTTGVFCRPTCPSRRAKPENIRLHESLDEARRTGFRACGRCRPLEPSLLERNRALVDQACRLLQTGQTGADLQRLAASFGLSLSQFHRIFSRTKGLSPRTYLRAQEQTQRAKRVPG